ncbi:rare lipoprotein A [Oryzisolibacter propanilivorax]|uniref:Endolytic peptidoglycan transglycosylase RlpA n=1 Tax=Oryzisolibacter propanilivorax TaxID=1527607 RepID=A0A1G9S1R2_9BURK|nr:rare lipoprotein A [Oryzisolibacter propanilivorax]
MHIAWPALLNHPGAHAARRGTALLLTALLVGCVAPVTTQAPPAPDEAGAVQGMPEAPVATGPAARPWLPPPVVPRAAPAVPPAEPALRIRPERSPLEASGPPALRLPRPEAETEPPVLLASGVASYYADSLHGRRTANGERYDREVFTAAHRSLPFGSRLCVRSLVNGRMVIVRVNDRGPFTPGRIIDLSRAAAEELGMTGLGIKSVELWQLGADEETCPDSLESPAEGSSLGLDAGVASKALQERPKKASKPRRRAAPKRGQRRR